MQRWNENGDDLVVNVNDSVITKTTYHSNNLFYCRVLNVYLLQTL